MGGGLRRRRRLGHRGAHHCRVNVGHAGPHHHHQQQARRGHQHCRRVQRAQQGLRQPDVLGRLRHAGGQPVLVQQAELQRRKGLPARGPAGALSDVPGGVQQRARQEPQGVHGLGQGHARWGELGIGRPGQPAPPGGRAVPRAERTQAHARALSRRSPGHPGRDRRPGVRDVDRQRHGVPVPRRQQGARHWRRQPAARGDHARCAHDFRTRSAGV